MFFKRSIKFYLLLVALGSVIVVLPLWAQEVERPTIQVDIGSFKTENFNPPSPCEGSVAGEGKCIQIEWIGQYVSAIYRWGVGVAAALAVLMIMVGGFLWLTSGGSPDRVSRGKDFITSSLLGLLLALFSFTILYTINPRLVALEPLEVVGVDTSPYISYTCDDNTDPYYLISSSYSEAGADAFCKDYCVGFFRTNDYRVCLSASTFWRCYCGGEAELASQPNYFIRNQQVNAKNQKNAEDTCIAWCIDYSGGSPFVVEINLKSTGESYNEYWCSCYYAN